ncbi:cellulose synthase-like protein G3 [Carex littledalei]|uniref:Cellulose synthase-like protein G3 n=1 Tax=Carex littledalei TaxID=544730 RepID=A0A833W074_9POAL|nr:cellulose synthase-like protein G3 [Carex littledalei]
MVPQMMYEAMKERVESAVEKGSVSADLVSSEQNQHIFQKWKQFSCNNHPVVIQVLLQSSLDTDITGHTMPNLIYVSREKSPKSSHNFKAGALNALIGFRYGTLVEDYYTGYQLHCEGWKSVLCNPPEPAFLGDVPKSLNDVLNQCKRWIIGLFEVSISRHCPLTFGVKKISLGAGLAYSHLAFWGICCIPIATYAVLPQLALIKNRPLFPEVYY